MVGTKNKKLKAPHFVGRFLFNERKRMKKIIMISLLAIVATNANAWEIISSYNNGIGGYDFYSSNGGYLGSSYENGIGGFDLFLQ